MSYKTAEQRRLEMVMALGLFDLTADDRQLLNWLATWDQETTDKVVSLFSRLNRPAQV